MTKEEMVAGLKTRIIDLSLKDFIESYEKAEITPKWDKESIEEVTFYRGLSEEEKRIFFNIARQIKIDTLAEVLAFLDGTYVVEGQKEDLKLVCLDNPEELLNEDVSTVFLNMIYDWDR